MDLSVLFLVNTFPIPDFRRGDHGELHEADGFAFISQSSWCQRLLGIRQLRKFPWRSPKAAGDRVPYKAGWFRTGAGRRRAAGLGDVNMEVAPRYREAWRYLAAIFILRLTTKPEVLRAFWEQFLRECGGGSGVVASGRL